MVKSWTDKGRFPALYPVPVILPHRQALIIGLWFTLRPKFMRFVTLGKPPQIAKRASFDLISDFQRPTFGFNSVLLRIFPACPLPKLAPIPVKAKCQITVSVYFHF